MTVLLPILATLLLLWWAKVPEHGRSGPDGALLAATRLLVIIAVWLAWVGYAVWLVLT